MGPVAPSKKIVCMDRLCIAAHDCVRWAQQPESLEIPRLHEQKNRRDVAGQLYGKLRKIRDLAIVMFASFGALSTRVLFSHPIAHNQ